MPTRRARRADAAAPTRAERVADRLHSAAIHLLRRLRRQDDESGLTAPRLSALSVVVFGGPMTLGQLAAAEQVRPPTMTRLVSALEAEGLVSREPDTHDARLTRVHPTAKARALLTAGRARRVDALARRLETLAPTDLQLLEKAADILDRVVRDRWDREE